MTKILITNAWSWYNKGDAAIVIAMVQSLRKFIPDANISVLSGTPEVDRSKYEKYGIKIFQRLRTVESNRKWKIIKGVEIFSPWIRRSLWAILYRLIKKDIKWLKGKESDVLDEYAESDVIVSCGGEVIWGNAGYILPNLLEIFLGKLLNKPVVIYAHSIGPFDSKLAELVTMLFLNRADLITLRESISEEYLQKIKVTKPTIIVTADVAFLLQPISPQEAKELLIKENVDFKKTLIGITLRRWIFPDSTDPEIKFKIYIKEVSKTIDFLIRKLNATVIFFPQVIVPNSEFEDDRIVAQEVYRQVTHKKDFKVLNKDYSPEELKGMIGQIDLFIGTRMHSNIFATSMYIPTMAIGYRHKTKGIMKILKLDEYVCDINNLNSKNVSKKIQFALANKEKIKENLKMEIKNMHDKALYNAELVKKLLEKFYGSKYL